LEQSSTVATQAHCNGQLHLRKPLELRAILHPAGKQNAIHGLRLHGMHISTSEFAEIECTPRVGAEWFMFSFTVHHGSLYDVLLHQPTDDIERCLIYNALYPYSSSLKLKGLQDKDGGQACV
jgi:hypothetical protein